MKNNKSYGEYESNNIHGSHEKSSHCEVIHNHESSCGCGHDHGNVEDLRVFIIRLFVGVGLFIGGFIADGIISTLLFILSYIILGYDVVFAAVKGLFSGQLFNENFLMSIATVGAFIIGNHPEATAVMLFYQVGELFQSMAVNRSRKSISELMNIRPDFANVYKDNNYIKVSPDMVHIGDRILVKAGEKIPLDGVVVEGSAFIDTSALTGEAVPRLIQKGDTALSGTINTNSNLTIEVKKEFANSTVSKILDLVENSAEKKSKSEKFITKFARYYTPCVVIIALLFAIIPPIITSTAFTPWIYKALTFLVVSCPCALVISIPLGFFGGIGGASKYGILLKGGNYLEELTKIDTVIFDKTGTLTEGVFEVSKVEGRDDVLEVAAYAEYYSNHPIAISIKNAYTTNGKEIDVNKISNYIESAGKGISVSINNKNIFAGNERLMKENHIKANFVDDIVGTVIYLAENGNYIGYIVISDKIKETSHSAIEKLKSMNIKTVMLTGDRKAIAQSVSNQMGIDEFYSDLLPEDKVKYLEKYLDKGSKVAFTGDGINDAPVLARADVGIAMGGLGSDAAIEAADVVIMTDDIEKIPVAINISKGTMRIIWQNIIFALGAKVVVMILSAFGISTMWMAIFADVGVALLAVLNSVRALFIKIK